ncbi:MAG: T9SS type A sorting domain-containing protein [Bacteroidales bacterium]|nr:T9SS type A sorting domain-containing protein [Bacteroidales bacterium]
MKRIMITLFLVTFWINTYSQDTKGLVYIDNFDAYIAGEHLVTQNPTDWTTWNISPGSNEDPYVSDFHALSGSNSIVIDESDDLVKPINNYTSGLYSITFFMFIPENSFGYFNTLQEFNGDDSFWGMQVYFDENGVGIIDGGGPGANTFTFPYNSWFFNKVIINLDVDWAQYYLNNVLIHEWIWSTGAFGTNSLNQLGGSNFYAWFGNGPGNPTYFIDNYKFEAGFFETAPPVNLQAEIFNQFNVHLIWEEAFNLYADLLGYNIYRNGEYLGFTEELFFDDLNVNHGLHQYFATALFDVGESDPSNFIEVEITSFFDDFDSYIPGGQLACQYPESWTTWNNLPCTYEDPYIIDTLAFSGSNSVVVAESNDLVKPINNFTSGIYKISFQMFIPDGEQGYFGILQEFDGDNSEVGGQMNFGSDSMIYFDCGGTSNPGIYNPGTWMKNDIIIDLNEDWANYYLDDIQFMSWQWSLGAFGTNNLNQLAGVSFKTFSWIIDEAKYFIDDFQIEEIEPNQLLPPENLTLETSGNDIILNWDSPYQEYWIHYDGENYGNGIGPGPVYIAARFLPEDIQALNGMFLTKIKFFARNSDCSYSLRVWTGENAGNLILEQDVPEFIPDSWNVIELSSPILIDASQELWLGNICSSINISDFPAACDEGPALPFLGDLISFDGINWASLQLNYGMDYNWNIRGLVTENTDNQENATHLTQHKIPSLFQSNHLKLKDLNSDKLPADSQNKNLTGYNIYHSFNWGSFELLDFTMDTMYAHENLLTGNYEYYVTALYDEGESIPSDTVSAFLTNIKENEINSIRISPNPAKDFVVIQSDQIIQNISLMNLSGQILWEYSEISKQNFSLPLRKYNPGIYIIRIEIEGDLIYRKIIIQ